MKYDIPGDFVECGVWRGGNTLAAALSYLRHGSRLPDLYLFDTFEGMSEPTDVDRAAGSVVMRYLGHDLYYDGLY